MYHSIYVHFVINILSQIWYFSLCVWCFGRDLYFNLLLFSSEFFLFSYHLGIWLQFKSLHIPGLPVFLQRWKHQCKLSKILSFQGLAANFSTSSLIEQSLSWDLPDCFVLYSALLSFIYIGRDIARRKEQKETTEK